MKEIKDYLHLYLPYKVRTNFGELHAMCNDGFTKCKMENGEILKGETDAIKPILRPLSSMTATEANTMLFNHGFSYDWVNCVQVLPYCVHYEFTYSTSKRLRKDNLRFDELTATDFAYLLSKHFDLFGLIEAGLAIDASTLEIPV